MFKIINDSLVQNLSTGAFIPTDTDNKDYVDYLRWVEEGNTPPPADPEPSKTYAELRAAEYPPLLDLIDGLVKDDVAQVQAYKDACLAVKAKYPKP